MKPESESADHRDTRPVKLPNSPVRRTVESASSFRVTHSGWPQGDLSRPLEGASVEVVKVGVRTLVAGPISRRTRRPLRGGPARAPSATVRTEWPCGARVQNSDWRAGSS
jgi:hypothetical protein